MPYQPTGKPSGRPRKDGSPAGSPRPEPKPAEPENLVRAVNYWRQWDERDPSKSGLFCTECFAPEQLGKTWHTVVCAHGTWYNIH
jgi:hypothetical protein